VSNRSSYTFRSVWNLEASKQEVWKALTAQPFSWDAWWPQLRDVHDVKYAKDLNGARFSCIWRSPAGYRLKSDVLIGEAIPAKQVTLHTDGDLRGRVHCHLSEDNGRTRINIKWEVETTRAWMNHLTFALRPIFVWNHHAVMRSGERGLQHHLQTKV
jgi:hypothetical protein